MADAEGKLIGQISGSKLGAEFYSGQGRLLEGENGSIYYSPSDYGNVVYEISGNDAAFRRETLQMKQIKFPCTTGKCYSAQQGLLCAGKDGILYQYNGSKWKTLLRYVDSSLQMQPYQMLQFSEEWMAAYYNDYVSDAMYFLTKTDASLLERDETELVLVASALTDELDQFITMFNRTSGYHITVEYYQGEDRVNRLDAKMVSSHPPDMIVLADETALKFSEKRMLEDLTPYLEASTVLNRADFLENVLEGYTLNGRLVCIPDTFYINLAIGRASHVGTHAGCTSEDVMALAETYPTAQLFKTPTFTSMTAFFWKDILTRYVDWESGECSFDGEDFRAFAEWMKAHSNGFGSGYAYDFGDSWDSSQEAVPDGQLLRPHSSILYDFSSLLSVELCFGESITAIGYPTFDGKPYYIGRGSSAIGITTNSKNKEAAWQFIEAFLSRDSNYSRQLPTRRELLAQKADAEMTPTYWRNEAGEIIYTEPDNEPGMNAKSWIVVEGESIPYYYLTKEQADMVMEVIETADFRPIYGGLWYNIITILLEELEPYVEGQRTLEESTRILQNRVRNLVQENL